MRPVDRAAAAATAVVCLLLISVCGQKSRSPACIAVSSALSVVAMAAMQSCNGKDESLGMREGRRTASDRGALDFS